MKSFTVRRTLHYSTVIEAQDSDEASYKARKMGIDEFELDDSEIDIEED